jgi:NAD(P)-dependent dehydrogenase (short-subunit alcohol dehydrogenase family)
MGRIDGKVAVVTGAASGIGAATAEVLAREGAKVVVADLNADGARSHAERISADGHEAVGIAFDLGDPASIEELIGSVVSRFGRIDVLHNNAAATHLAATRDSPILQADPEVWDDTLRINVRGTALMIKAVVPHMIERGGGSIINTSSGAGAAGDLSHTAYGASKAAINAITLYAATQFGKQGVRVNAIAPGLIETSATATSGHTGPLRDIMLANHLTPRLGTPIDIANAVLFLASDESSFVTGQIMGVDGGVLSHAPYYSEFMAQSSA